MFVFSLRDGLCGCIEIHADAWNKVGRITFSGVPRSLWGELEESQGMDGGVTVHQGCAKAADLAFALRHILPGCFRVERSRERKAIPAL